MLIRSPYLLISTFVPLFYLGFYKIFWGTDNDCVTSGEILQVDGNNAVTIVLQSTIILKTIFYIFEILIFQCDCSLIVGYVYNLNIFL